MIRAIALLGVGLAANMFQWRWQPYWPAVLALSLACIMDGSS